MNVLESQITIYDNVWSRHGRTATFGEFVRLGFENRDKIDLIRKMSPEDRRINKATLPAATISGVFGKDRRKESLIIHSGLMCIDIDHVEDCNETMNKLAEIDNIAFISRSVSGKGVFAIIPIAYPEKHEAHYNSFSRYLKGMGIDADDACKDVSRLRICSYDDNYMMRKNPVVYTGLWENPKPQQRESKTYENPDIDVTLNRVKNCCREIEESGLDITNDYQDWIKIGFSLASLIWEGAEENEVREYYHVVSRVSSKYNAAGTDKKFDNIRTSGNPERINIGCFFNICKQYGIVGRCAADDFIGMDLMPDDIESNGHISQLEADRTQVDAQPRESIESNSSVVKTQSEPMKNNQSKSVEKHVSECQKTIENTSLNVCKFTNEEVKLIVFNILRTRWNPITRKSEPTGITLDEI